MEKTKEEATPLKEGGYKLERRCIHDGREVIKEMSISCVPTVDVKPVRHGKWIWSEDNWCYCCSVCGITFDYDKTYGLFDHGFQLANYCPYCGAKMEASDE